MTSPRSSKHALALTLVLAALASAAPAAAGAAGGSALASRQSGVQIIRISGHGFDWTAAGIGAAAGVGLSMLALGGGLVVAGARRPGQSSDSGTGSAGGTPTLRPMPASFASGGLTGHGRCPAQTADVSTEEKEQR